MFKKIITLAVKAALLGLVVTIFGFALNTGLKKEADRMDFVRVDNCAKYGAHINKIAGKEVCPPTPQG